MRPLSAALAALVVSACQPEEVVPRAGGGGTAASTTKQLGGSLILGGTVTPAAGGDFAFVSDPERDLVHIIDVRNAVLRKTVRLTTGSEPSRGVEDRSGRVHLVLRGTGQIATIGISSGALLTTTSVCPEPRGIAFDRTTDALIVACASGELVTLPSSGSSSVRRLGTDLRDVIVQNGKLRVTSFRSATLIEPPKEQVAPTVTSLPSISLPSVDSQPAAFVPTLAWRAVPGPDDSVVIAHQRSVEGDIDSIRVGLPPVVVPYYTNPCASPIVRSALTVVDANGTPRASVEIPGALPVDVAVSGDTAVVITAGNSQLTRLSLSTLSGVSGGLCGSVGATPPSLDPMTRQPTGVLGQPVGVAFVGNDSLLIHSRSPARVILQPSPTETRFTSTQQIDLEGFADAERPGAALFHTSTSAGLACASCHPEGGEDGHVWTFFRNKRRTQPLTGGVIATAPFHWKGDLRDLPALLADTFVARMGGTMPSADETAELSAYLDRIPTPKAPTLDRQVNMAKGKAAFDKAGCEGCHAGATLTTSTNTDVGTGSVFQVPSLRGLGRRAPYMHDGCAKTLEARFSDPACGGDGRHGDLTLLAPDERDALLDYLTQL